MRVIRRNEKAQVNGRQNRRCPKQQDLTQDGLHFEGWEPKEPIAVSRGTGGELETKRKGVWLLSNHAEVWLNHGGDIINEGRRIEERQENNIYTTGQTVEKRNWAVLVRKASKGTQKEVKSFRGS